MAAFPEPRSPERENNPKSDFMLLSLRFLVGPFAMCNACRKACEVQDLGQEGCKVLLHFCAKCRANNKTLSYKMRFLNAGTKSANEPQTSAEDDPKEKKSKKGEEEEEMKELE